MRFKIISDHRALQHIFSPAVSVGKSTSIMLQRWTMDLSACDYEIAHRPGKQIPHADYLSRHAYHTPPDDDATVLMVNPLPVHRNQPIKAAREAYRSILSALKHGWSISAKKNIPQIYAQREDLSIQPDGVIMIKERALIPPTCRATTLQHLHMGHLGRDKMISVSRLLCCVGGHPSILTL